MGGTEGSLVGELSGSSGSRTVASAGLDGAVGPEGGCLLVLAEGSSFDSDRVDLLRSLALQNMLRNFFPNTKRTTRKAVLITIITITRGMLAAP